ncbi:hypothetical protein LCGC14_2900710, partial [marine sediment metagenome]
THKLKKFVFLGIALLLGLSLYTGTPQDYIRVSLSEIENESYISDTIDLKDARHPIIEAALPIGEFIANDTFLDNKTISYI